MPEYTSHHYDQANSYQEIGRYPVGSRQKENGISKKKMINGAAANHLKAVHKLKGGTYKFRKVQENPDMMKALKIQLNRKLWTYCSEIIWRK